MEFGRSIMSFLLMFGPLSWLFLLFRRRNQVSPDSPNVEASNHTNNFNKSPFRDHSKECLSQDLQSIWKRPVDRLPVHVDIPRLAKRMEVYVNGERRMISGIPDFDEGSTATDYSVPRMYSLFSLLTNLLEGEEEQKNVENMFYTTFSPFSPALVQFVKEGKIDDTIEEPNYDVARTLGGFLQKYGENTKLVNILKATNQSFLSAGVLRLKYLIGGANAKDLYSAGGLNYKDVKGGWKILAHFYDDKVTVIHRRWEQSFLPDSFKFVWEMSASFDPTTETMLDAGINIPQVNFGTADTPERQKLFYDAAQTYMEVVPS